MLSSVSFCKTSADDGWFWNIVLFLIEIIMFYTAWVDQHSRGAVSAVECLYILKMSRNHLKKMSYGVISIF